MGCGLSKDEQVGQQQLEDDRGHLDVDTELDVMGGSHSKKSKGEKRKSSVGSDSNPDPSNDEEDPVHLKSQSERSHLGILDRYRGEDGALHANSEVSASQINFFKMLDEKIERGLNDSKPDDDDSGFQNWSNKSPEVDVPDQDKPDDSSTSVIDLTLTT